MQLGYALTIIIIAVTAVILLAQNPIKVDSAGKQSAGPADSQGQIIKGQSDSLAKGQTWQGPKGNDRDSVNVEEISTEPITSETQLREKYDIHEVIRNNTGAITGIWGKIDLADPTGEIESDAIRLLNNLAPIYGLELARVEYQVSKKSDQKIVFQQYYQGIRVYGRQICVSFLSPSTVISVYGTFLKGISLSPVPSLSAEQAESIAVRDFGTDRGALIVHSGEHVEFEEFNGQLHLDWLIDVRDTLGASAYWYRIDAHTGDILRKQSQEMNIDAPHRSEGSSSHRGRNSLDDCPFTFSGQALDDDIAVTAVILLAQNPVQEKGEVDSTRNQAVTSERQANQGAKTKDRVAPITSETELRQRYNIENVRFDSSGVLRSLFGHFVLTNATSDVETNAISLMDELAPLFGFSSVQSEYRVELKSNDIIKFQQYFHDIPVDQSEIFVYFSPSAPEIVQGVLGTYTPNIQINAIPTIDVERASEIAVQDFTRNRESVRITRGTLKIGKFDDEYHLYWTFTLSDSLSSNNWYEIDAHTGAILTKSNMEENIDAKHSTSESSRGNDR